MYRVDNYTYMDIWTLFLMDKTAYYEHIKYLIEGVFIASS